MATSCEELTHWKIPCCWEELGAGGEGDDRRWDGWVASPTQWTWVWVDSGSWWWTGRPGVLRFMGSQSQKQLNYWTELNWKRCRPNIFSDIIVARATCTCAQSSCRISLFLLISWPLCCCRLATLVVLSHFYVNFHFNSYVLMKKFTGISIGMMIILWMNLWRINILKISHLPTQEQNICFILFGSTLIILVFVS